MISGERNENPLISQEWQLLFHLRNILRVSLKPRNTLTKVVDPLRAPHFILEEFDASTHNLISSPKIHCFFISNPLFFNKPGEKFEESI